MLDFLVFIGENEQSIVEHISRPVGQCNEANNEDRLKLRLFTLSL